MDGSPFSDPARLLQDSNAPGRRPALRCAGRDAWQFWSCCPDASRDHRSHFPLSFGPNAGILLRTLDTRSAGAGFQPEGSLNPLFALRPSSGAILRRVTPHLTMDAAHIRNFSIIAHIDHGKTTLSDRLLHRTGTIMTRDMTDQLLDSMDLERERGITIKAHPVTMLYKAKNGETYELNLIDTPGHFHFSNEVSRSLSACEGALLIIDAAQGVEAQTVANVHLAMKQNLTIIPVINKIDLPHADVALAKTQLEDILAIPGDTAILASAKEGIGIEDILEAIVARIPAPKPTGAVTLQALGFDSYFDTYKGVVTHVRVFNGELKAGMQVKLLHSGKNVEVKEVGSFNPKPYARERLEVGETGYFTANIKSPKEVKMGDTVTDARHPSPVLPGFKEIHPMVFNGIYPINTSDYEHLKAAMGKL